ncbi:signal transduction histidine kinase/ligand-binding sensor domain-containing protein/DNA-binding response OmpR family regulator [Parabacteroides sp. PFB2-12]|nr:MULTISPECIES: two-component regulator propeller domain-containing protein [unclassified Parabacteroides]MDH6342756.1 signal transduction histidine kinase/ligand-binding sensor domain-containing protein/DNA-binding response OmpR family regulator [Parabacteroides sp. PM6-13]MDH6391476.1 signal transduction histidine kinase/ligand-binding sensor domain-containing protein/DNA-binding response OmpR family regulator [Parabacteroides sp. PFB2-12]
MRPHSYIVILFCILFSCPTTRAQESFTSRNNFTYITMEDGLLHDFIDYIYKDSRGFLWLATRGGGISRYDGYEFIHYTIHTPDGKVRSNFITGCCEDAFGRLWIASTEGIDVLDLSTDKMVTLAEPQDPAAAVFQQSVSYVTKDNKGNIWIACDGTIYKITFDANGGLQKCYSLETGFSDYPVVINDMDGDGNVWLAVGHKVSKVFTRQDELHPTTISPQLEFNESIRISSLCRKENEIWIGTNLELIRYDRNRESLKSYYSNGTQRGLTQTFITDLALNRENQLLVSTYRGFNVYNPITDDFEQIMLDTESPEKGLNSNFINCMMADGDIVWIGTESGGLNKITPKSLSIKNYVYEKYDPHSLSPNPVNAIYEDEKETLWVGTVEGGINRKEKGSERFIHYTTANSGLSHNSVSEIVKDNRNQLWVGTWGGGITVFDPERPGMPAVKYFAPWHNPGFHLGFVASLCYDPINDLMWIGADEGLYYYDFKTDRLYNPFYDEQLSDQIHCVSGVIIDPNGLLWMGTMYGVFVFDLHSRKNDKFRHSHLKYKLDDPTSRLREYICYLFLASDNTLWLGSNGNGLFKHIPNEDGTIGHFINYNNHHGLISNNVRGILEDDRKRLWINTNYGISCFDLAANSFTNYTSNNGLMDNKFYWNGALASQSGMLYFGGIKGLAAIDPKTQTLRTHNTKVTLTELSVMNQRIKPGKKYIDRDISTVKAIHLHESDKSFSLEFAALNFDSPVTARYSYRLVGFDPHWIEVPADRRFANYTNLPAGDYVFEVKYSIDDEEVDPPVTKVQVIVTPFFYKTPWFISLLMISVICLIVYIYIRRIDILQKQKQHLHKIVDERTHELREQKQLLEVQAGELSHQNEMLKHQNDEITRQKTQLIEMSEKVQELTADKISFFTSITHEFRTPVTLITGPIERALKLSHNPLVIEQLSFVERNAKYLLSLVNQIMDFRKVESGKLQIVKTKGNFRHFISTLISPFAVLAEGRKITLRQYMRIDTDERAFDQDAMQKVITNLLSNAIKFTPDGGTISLYAAILNDRSGKRLYIAVRDNGIGIPEADISNIFDRFYQSKNKVKFPVYGQSGTGIGLYLSKSIITQMGGTISAANNKGAGSSFRVVIPIDEASPGQQEIVAGKPLFPEEKEDQPISSFIPGKLTLLVVEDNQDMRSFIRSILIEQYNVIEAGNGEEALELLKANNVDFIVSDLMMPVMDGVELSRRVKKNFTTSHIPFLMLTAKTSQESRIESYKMGVDSFLSKPFNDELLLTRINNILENRSRYHSRFAQNMDVRELQMVEESRDEKFINKALSVVQENYKNPSYESAEFVKSMGVSKSLLNKKLQTLTGQSLGQFIRNYRLNVARELIEVNRITKKMNISEIAYEVGFNDPKYFTRCFVKRFNVTPTELMEHTREIDDE